MKTLSYIRQKSGWLILSAVYLSFVITINAFGGIVTEPVNTSSQEQYVDVNDMNNDEIIATLKNDIKAIDEQMAQCKKQKKGWTAATVIGGIGIVGTGIGALVQNNQIKNKKTELKTAQDELRSIK
ncbi:MAG: hypothetical protein IJ560_03270 [Alphaproteobacteria bacterium]|nr:hypothetical protein [Alphaproteobacteria bacterium]